MTYQNYLADRGDMWQLQMNYMKPQYQSPALDVRRSADPYNPLIFITNNTTSQSNVTQSRSVASVGTGLLSAVAAAPAPFPRGGAVHRVPSTAPTMAGPAAMAAASVAAASVAATLAAASVQFSLR